VNTGQVFQPSDIVSGDMLGEGFYGKAIKVSKLCASCVQVVCKLCASRVQVVCKDAMHPSQCHPLHSIPRFCYLYRLGAQRWLSYFSIFNTRITVFVPISFATRKWNSHG